jgi:uncharacterized protein (TIGR02147 family)
MMPTARTRIYNFSDPVEFLRSEFTFRKKLDPDFSVRQWSAIMGLEKPDLLVSLLKGKKAIRLRYLKFLKKGISLDATEELYFETLLLKRNSKDLDEQAVFERLLQGLSPGEAVKSVISTDTDVLSDWATIALLVALEVPEYRTESALITVFQDKLKSDEIRTRLAVLKEKGLVTETEGELRASQQRISTPTDWDNSAIHRYYSTASDLAKSAIPLDVHEREFQCFSIATSSEDLPAFKEMIRQFRTKMASRALHAKRPDAVYQMNMQFFPVTQSVSRPAGEASAKASECSL